MSLSFSRNCILKIVAGMLGEEMAEITDDIKDAVGELTNNDLRRGPSETGGPGVQVSKLAAYDRVRPVSPNQSPVQGPTIAIPFETPAGSFAVEVSFEGE